MWCRPSLRRGLLGALGALGSFAGQAIAGPPLITDDPGTPGPNRWEINVAGQLEYGPTDVLITAPDLDVNYGVGAAWQLKVEWPLELTGAVDQDLTVAAGNPTLGVKWRFIDQATGGVDLSVYPQFDFNTSTSAEFGLLDAGTEVLVPIEAGRAIGDLDVYADLGYDLVVAGADTVWGGVAASVDVGHHLDLTAELHGEAPATLTSIELACNAGLTYDLDDTFTLLASGGTATLTGGPDVLGYVGLQVHR